MMPNITKGTRLRGLLEYLFGPGRREEHVNARLVAGYDDLVVLAPPRHGRNPDRWDLGELVDRLDAPQSALGERGLRDYVLHCSLAVPVDERPVDDAEWRTIAEEFVARMGWDGCRWVAVHHGRSSGGNDHVHVVVTRATEDGAPLWLRGEYRQAQQACDGLEDEHGLLKRARRDGAGRPGATPVEVAQARAAGRPATGREVLRRHVRAAVAAAGSEAEWLSGMRAAGLLVAARTAADDPTRVVGYAVALPPEPGRRPRWIAGGRLDGELSLTRIRHRWPETPPLDATAWQATDATLTPTPARPVDRAQVWRRTATTLADVAAQLHALPPDSPQWPAAARATADLLTCLAVVAEPAGYGPLSRAADALTRAAAPRRHDPPVTTTTAVAARLSRAAARVATTGPARTSREAHVLLTVVVQAARLLVALADLRAAQHQAAAAGAAAAAAAHLMPVLEYGRPVPVPPQPAPPTAERAPAPAPAAPEEPSR